MCQCYFFFFTLLALLALFLSQMNLSGCVGGGKQERRRMSLIRPSGGRPSLAVRLDQYNKNSCRHACINTKQIYKHAENNWSFHSTQSNSLMVFLKCWSPSHSLFRCSDMPPSYQANKLLLDSLWSADFKLSQQGEPKTSSLLKWQSWRSR